MESTRVPPSGFDLLPSEILFKILRLLEDRHLLQCAEISSLNLVAVDILLQRNELQDPRAYCEVQIRLPDRLTEPSLADSMSILLASKRRYESFNKWRCILRPSRVYDAIDMFYDEESQVVGPTENPNAEPVTQRAAFMFRRLSVLLSRVDALEEVSLEVVHWTWFSGWFSRPLEDLLNRIVFEKGCSHLHLDTGLTAFAKSHNWESLASSQSQLSKPKRSRILAKLTCGLLDDSTPDFTAQASQSSTRRSRLVKIQMNSLFFHPQTLSWISTLFTLSHNLADFTVTLSNASRQCSDFVDYGLTVLLRTAPRLEALTLLRATKESFRDIVPQLHRFETLKRLTISVNINFWRSSSLHLFPVGSVPVAFIPSNVKRLSISPELISYVLPGILMTKVALEQLEVVYQEVAAWTSSPPRVNEDTASMRQCFDTILAPISIAVKLPIEAKHLPVDDTPAWHPNFRTVYTDSLSSAHTLLKRDCVASGGNGFPTIDVFQVDCNPLELETPESIENCIGLVQMFPRAREIAFHNVRHSWEAWKPLPAYTLLKDTADEVVRRVYSECADLTCLRIGEEVYLRPRV